jgi:hypothetical protein
VRPGISTFSIVHSFTDADVWHHVILPGLRSSFGPAWWFVLLAAAAGLVAGLVVSRDRSVQLAAVAGVACVMSYVLTKQGFNLRFWHGTPRYAAPGLALGLVILPVALARVSRRAPLSTLPLYGGALVATQVDSQLWRAWWPRSHHLPVVVTAVVVLGAGIAAVAWSANRTRLALRPAPAIGLAVLVVVSLASGLALRSYRPTFADHGTPGEQAAALLRARHVRHTRIALTGSLLVSGSQYAFYDKKLSNSVQFIAEQGSDHRAVPFTRCDAFIRAVARGRYRYVIAAGDGAGGVNPTAWLQSNPAARRLDHAPGSGAAVFEVVGRLEPATCEGSR